MTNPMQAMNSSHPTRPTASGIHHLSIATAAPGRGATFSNQHGLGIFKTPREQPDNQTTQGHTILVRTGVELLPQVGLETDCQGYTAIAAHGGIRSSFATHGLKYSIKKALDK